MVTSFPRLVYNIQKYMCYDPESTVIRAAQLFGVSRGFVKRCMKTEDIAVLRKHYTQSQAHGPTIKPKVKTTHNRETQLEANNGQPASSTLSESRMNTLEITVATATTPEPTKNLDAIATRSRNPYTPANMKNVPVKRAAKYQEPKPRKSIPAEKLLRLPPLVVDIPAACYRAQMFGKMEGIYTQLEASLRLWQAGNYKGIFEILDEPIPLKDQQPRNPTERKAIEQERRRTSGLRLQRLASFLGKHLDHYESTLRNNDPTLTSKEEADNLEYFVSIQGELQRMRKLKDHIFDLGLLTHEEFHKA